MKKNILLLASSLFLLASCGGGGENPPASTTTISSSEVITQYSVTLMNAKNSSIISTTKVDEGSSFARPSDPSYASHVFGGWYLDEATTDEAIFPITVTRDLTLYAKFTSAIELFLDARDNTILDSSSFQYASFTNIKVSYELVPGTPLEFNGNQEGETKYNAGSEVSFLETHENSGSLFYDGFKTDYKKGNTLYKISENEDHDVTGYETETVDDSFRYESSSFAKALFEYKEEDIVSVTASGNRYELKTKESFSSIASLVLSYVNNAMVEKVLGNLPETTSDFHMYVSFEDSYLKSYSYEFSVEVQGILVEVTYEMNFVNRQTVTITEPSFPGLYINKDEVTNALKTVSDAMLAYKLAETSAYDFKIDSTVVTPTKSVGVTSQGSTKRRIKDFVVYYSNVLEVDSELKDADMYKDAGVEDYKRTRAKLADGSVYDANDRVWPLSNEFTEVTNTLMTDEFYGLISETLLEADKVDAVQKTSETAYDEYSLIINKDLFIDIMDFVNGITRIDHTLTNTYYPLGEYSQSTIVMKDADFLINITDGLFSGMAITLSGAMNTVYEGTEIGGESTFDLTIDITATEDGANYVIPETTDDIL